MDSKILSTVKQAFLGIGSLNRNLYRSVRRDRPELNLPSERQIQKEFGSFGEFKGMIEKDESKERVVTKEEIDLINETEGLFFDGCIKTRDDYRKVKSQNPSLNLPSCDKISKILGSFSNFKSIMIEHINNRKNIVENIVENTEEEKPFLCEVNLIEEEELVDSVDLMEEEELDPAAIIKWKESIKKTRLEIFGTTQKPFYWQPESRKGLGRW